MLPSEFPGGHFSHGTVFLIDYTTPFAAACHPSEAGLHFAERELSFVFSWTFYSKNIENMFLMCFTVIILCMDILPTYMTVYRVCLVPEGARH